MLDLRGQCLCLSFSSLVIPSMTDWDQNRGNRQSSLAAYATWAPWLKKMNQMNLNSPTQRFLLTFDNDIPVAIALELIRPKSIGLYAVATHPLHQKKGYSTALLNHSLNSYRRKMIVLQVQTASYAHRFYSNLGFKNELEFAILSKTT